MADAGLSAPGLLPLEEQYALLLAFDWVYAQLLHIGSGARATLTLEAFVLSLSSATLCQIRGGSSWRSFTAAA